MSRRWAPQMTSPHGCGKSQGGDRPCRKFSCLCRATCLFLFARCLGCGRSTSTRKLVVPLFNDAFQRRPDDFAASETQIKCASCVAPSCHRVATPSSASRHATTASHGRLPGRARYPPTPQPCFAALHSPLGGSVRRGRRTAARALGCEFRE